MVHLSGKLASIRAGWVRALAVSLALAGALTLAGCYSDEGYQLPAKAMKELSPEMVALLQQKNMPKDSPILVRIFKEESELEIWKQTTSGRFELLKVYPICRWSGELGPKVKEGDRQAPEGFYSITPGLMNPNSNYYLAINIGFPNAFDKANGRTGAFLMIHGDCSSSGCYAMTDEQIGEIYSLARESFLGGQKEFQIQAYPFRMTAANLARHRTNPNMPFWRNLKEGNDHFEVSHLEPKVDVCDKHYVFDAQAPGNSSKPLAFNPAGRCPAYEVNPEIASLALEKERNDDYQIAQLINRGTPAAPIVMGTDGGMNRVFVAKLDQETASYDDEGHVHAPPIHPGMPRPTISAPVRPEDRQAELYNPAQPKEPQGGFLAALFGSKPAAAPATSDVSQAAPTQVAATTGSIGTNAPAAATQKPKPVMASLRLKPVVEARKSEPGKNAAEPQKSEAPQTAEAATKPKAKPQQEANATAAPAAHSGGLISGAQPVVPVGTFDGRWAGLQ